MPVSVVVGGQYGSEGKGKVTHWLAREQRAQYAIRVGGPNSGHTVVENGRRVVLRHLPTPVLINGVIGVVPAGAYLDVDILLREVEETGLTKDRLLLHPSAVVIDDSMRADEREGRLGRRDRVHRTGRRRRRRSACDAAVIGYVCRQRSSPFAGSFAPTWTAYSPGRSPEETA